MGGDVYCRNCGVRLRRVLGQWWHTQRIGAAPCPRAEPENETPPAKDAR